jgi:hypothetical protein
MQTKTKIVLTRLMGEYNTPISHHMHLHTMVMPQDARVQYSVHKSTALISKDQFDKMTLADEFKETLKTPNCVIEIN